MQHPDPSDTPPLLDKADLKRAVGCAAAAFMCLPLGLTCAHRRSGGDGPASRRDSAGRKDTAAARKSGEAGTVRYAVLKPARWYNDPKALTRPAASPGIPGNLYRAVTGTSRQLGRIDPTPDRRLEEVAQDLASLPLDGLPPQDLLAFMVWSRGILEPVPLVLRVVTTDPGGTLAVRSIRARLLSLMANRTFQKMGAGSFRRSGSPGPTVVLLLMESHLETTPVPRQTTCGRTLRFSGRILAPFKAPSLVIATPKGTTAKGLVKSRDGRFKAELVLAKRSGRYQVELLAQGPAGPTVLANFPVYCGVKPPSHYKSHSPTVARASPRKPPKPSAAEAELLRLIQSQRRKAGRKPLAVLPHLSRVARAHSQEMCASGKFGHFSRRTGSADDRVRRADFRPRVVAENVAQAGTAQGAHSALMGSPSHRANIVSPTLTHVGVGVSVCPKPDGSRQLLVTEIFVAW